MQKVFQTIKESGKAKLLLDVGLKLAESLCKKNQDVSYILNLLKEALNSREGDNRKNYEYKIYAVKIKIAFDNNDKVILRSIYKKIKDTNLDNM